jgi:hypothetical protein
MPPQIPPQPEATIAPTAEGSAGIRRIFTATPFVIGLNVLAWWYAVSFCEDGNWGIQCNLPWGNIVPIDLALLVALVGALWGAVTLVAVLVEVLRGNRRPLRLLAFLCVMLWISVTGYTAACSGLM